MPIVNQTFSFGRLFEIDDITSGSFGGASGSSNNTLTLTGLAQVSPTYETATATIDDQDGNGNINAVDSVSVTFPGDASPTTLDRIDTSSFSGTGSGFGSGGTFALFEDPVSGQQYVYFSTEFDLSSISGSSVTLTEQGDAVGNMAIADMVVCFEAGTWIGTPDGARRVGELSVGDPVIVRGGAVQRVRWIVTRRVPGRGRFRPVRIRRGALGRGLPTRDLLVSRQHRVLVASRIAERITGAPRVLVPAIKLCGLPGIDLDRPTHEVRYVHFLLDRHEIVMANGAPLETLLLGPTGLGAMSPCTRRGIDETLSPPGERSLHMKPALPIPSGRDVSDLVRRHRKNGKPLLETWNAGVRDAPEGAIPPVPMSVESLETLQVP